MIKIVREKNQGSNLPFESPARDLYGAGLLIPVNLSFFDEEKTEKATPRKKEKAREEGQVALSKEVGVAFSFLAMFYALRAFAGGMYRGLLNVFEKNLNLISSGEDIMLTGKMSAIIVDNFYQVIMIGLPIFIVAMVVGFLVNFAQVGWQPTSKTLQPKFSKMNPIKGFQRIFSMRSLLELVKSIAKFGIILVVIYNGLIAQSHSLSKFIDMELAQGVAYIADSIAGLGINVAISYLFIAAIDFMYTRWKHAKDLRMSKQEIKEEYKNTEGNPEIKGRIRQKMREAAMRRMMGDVPKADVIITNPTHYAVAIKYDAESDAVPIVLAKGVDFLAKRIKEVALENNVVIVENKPLARTLYATVDIGKQIPPELYAAVAEILAYVYKLKRAV